MSEVSIHASPAVVTWGGKVTLTGTLSCSQELIMQAAMTLRRNQAGEDGLHEMGTATTNDNGDYVFSNTPGRNSVYRVDWDPKSTNNGTALAGTTCSHGTSPAQMVYVRPGIVFNTTSGSSIARAGTARFGGKLVPKRPGERLNLQVLQSSKWRDAVTVRVDRNGNYAASYRRSSGSGPLVFRIAYPTQSPEMTWNVSRTVRVTWR